MKVWAVTNYFEGKSRQGYSKKQWLGLGLLAVLLLAAMCSLQVGAVKTSLHQVVSAMLYWAGEEATLGLEQQTVLMLRLPRLLLAMLVGSALAVSGVACQGLFRNPLADPAMIGVAAGAAFGAAITIVLSNVLLGTAVASTGSVALGAFVGGLLATLAVWLIAYRGVGVATLLLAGIAINAIVFAGIGLLQYLANDQQLRDLTFWSLGSLGAASWERLLWVAPGILLSIAVLIKQAKALNALLLGESEAHFMGFSVQRVQQITLLFTALAVSLAVAFTGVISFVGLVVPHLLRLVIGPDHNALLPTAALGGAILVVVADTLARTIAAPAELPLGVLISLIGGPFFLYLLITSKMLRQT